MTRLRQRRSRERRGLSKAERSHLFGSATGGDASPFATEAAAREAWQRHRDELMAAHQPGERPEGWWAHESSAPPALREPIPTYGWLDRPVAEQAAARVDQNDREDRRLGYLAWAGELTAAEVNLIRDGRDGVRRLALIAKASPRD